MTCTAGRRHPAGVASVPAAQMPRSCAVAGRPGLSVRALPRELHRRRPPRPAAACPAAAQAGSVSPEHLLLLGHRPLRIHGEAPCPPRRAAAGGGREGPHGGLALRHGRQGAPLAVQTGRGRPLGGGVMRPWLKAAPGWGRRLREGLAHRRPHDGWAPRPPLYGAGPCMLSILVHVNWPGSGLCAPCWSPGRAYLPIHQCLPVGPRLGEGVGWQLGDGAEQSCGQGRSGWSGVLRLYNRAGSPGNTRFCIHREKLQTAVPNYC